MRKKRTHAVVSRVSVSSATRPLVLSSGRSFLVRDMFSMYDVVLISDHRLPLYRVVDLLIRLLDQATRYRREPTVWRVGGARYERPDLRLGADHLDWQSTDGSVVG